MHVSGHWEITKKPKEENKNLLYSFHQKVITVYTVVTYNAEGFLVFISFAL